MTNLQRTQIVDANGHVTHRNKKVDDTSVPRRKDKLDIPMAPPMAEPLVSIEQLNDAKYEVASAMTDYPGTAQEALRDSLVDNTSSNGERALLLIILQRLDMDGKFKIAGDMSPSQFAFAFKVNESIPTDRLAERISSTSITDETMRDTFGSQWAAVCEAVMKAGSISSADAEAIYAGDRDEPTAMDLFSVWSKIRADSPRTAASADSAAAAVRTALYDGNDQHALEIARLAERSIRALTAREFIGKFGFTQEHYDRQTAHLVRGIGKLHPND